MDQLQKYKLKLSQTETACNNELKRLQDLKRDTGKAETILNGINSEIEKRGKDLDIVNEKCSQKEEEIKKNEVLAGEQRNNLYSIKKLIIDNQNKYNKDVSMFNSDIERLKDDKENNKVSNEKNIRKCKADLNELKIEIDNRENKKNLLSNRITELNSDLKRKELEVNELSDQLSGLKKKIELSKSNISLLSEDVVDKKSKVDVINIELRKTKESLGGLFGELEAIEKKKNAEELLLDKMEKYRFSLAEKGEAYNNALPHVISAYKKAEIRVPASLEPLEIPKV